MLDDHALAEELQRLVRRDVEQALVPLAERKQHAEVVLGQVAGQRPLEAAEDRLPLLRLRTEEHERVVGDADEGRGSTVSSASSS